MMCVCLPVWKAWSWPILVLLWMLWFMAFKCPEWDSQLCHKENNWIENVFLLAAEPMVLVGVGACSPFLSVSRSAVLLWIHEGFPNKALEIVIHFAIKTYMTMMWNPGTWLNRDLVKQRSWRAGPATQAGRNINALEHVSPSGVLVLGPWGLRVVFTCEASSRERIHVVLFVNNPILSLQFTSTHSQPARKGWWLLCSYGFLCHWG